MNSIERIKDLALKEVVEERDQLKEKLAIAVEALEYFSNARRRTVHQYFPGEPPENKLMIEADNEVADEVLHKIRGGKE